MAIHRNVALIFIVLVSICVDFASSETAGTAPATMNLDFENGEIGEVPLGWATRGNDGYLARLTDQDPQSGTGCAVLTHDTVATADFRGWDDLSQTFDATPFRGKRVRLRAAVRTENLQSSSQSGLVLRVDLKSGAVGFWDNMHDRPIESDQWREFEIIGSVSHDAEKITIGVFQSGMGTTWIDSVSFQTLGPIGEGDEPSGPLAGRALENLLAFARLYGYLRFFHPSDAAIGTDWDRFAIEGVRFVEGAKDPSELADRLEAFFRPLAPTVRVWPSDSETLPCGRPILESPDEDAPNTLAMYHRGIAIKGGPNHDAYFSSRVESQQPRIDDSGAISQRISPIPFRDRNVRLRVWLRTEIQEGLGAAWLKLEFGGGHDDANASGLTTIPVDSRSWKEYTLEAMAPLNADWMECRVEIAGRGRLWVDAVRIDVIQGETETAISELVNADFEIGESGKEPPGWDGPDAGRSIHYWFTTEASGAREGKRCAVFVGEPISKNLFPSHFEPFVAVLDGGVTVSVPLSLLADGGESIPRTPQAWQLSMPNRPEGWRASANDRSTRLANVIIAWNVFQHFYPYFDEVDSEWEDVLRQSLMLAASDPDGREFLETLRVLIAALDDCHGSVYHPVYRYGVHPPVLWEWIEDSIVVTAVSADAEGKVRPGDVVQKIDGKPALESLQAQEKLFSGATLQWRRWRALGELGDGEPNSKISLQILTPDGVVRTVSLVRNEDGAPVKEPRPEPFTEIHPGVYYINLGRLENEQFIEVLPQLSQARGIVMDLREHLGISPKTIAPHLIDETIPLLLLATPVVMQPDGKTTTFQFHYGMTAIPEEPRFRGKVVVIADGRAMSADETLLGMLEHFELAEIVGSTSAGTNGVINTFSLPGGFQVQWTGMKVVKLDGSQHHGIGIAPTVPVSRTISGVTEGRDELLEKAVSLIEE